MWKRSYLFRVGVLLSSGHDAGRLAHHVGHAVHGIVGLDLRGVELGHVGDLVHALGHGLLAQQDLGLLVGLLRVALLQELLDLLLDEGVALDGLLGLATSLLGVEASLELDLHVAGHLTVGHGGGIEFWLEKRSSSIRVSAG